MQIRENYLTTHIHELDQRASVRGELAEIAVTGVAVNRGEIEPDDSGVGSPILASDQVAAVLCVSGPTARILARIDEITSAAKKSAHKISEHMRAAEKQLQRNLNTRNRQ